ncbi:MAG: hypothetical protein HXS53_09830 [Theionarchaea archaeon]|nr:hypothetical protein [Theionarchaea archaeon]
MKPQLSRAHLTMLIFLTCMVIITWQHSLVESILFSLRVLIYEQPLLVLIFMGIYLSVAILLTLKRPGIVPVMLSILVLFAVIFNLFASYQEILKFGITQGVFTDLFRIFFHFLAAPLALLTMEVHIQALMGLLAMGLIILKGYVVVRKWIECRVMEKIILSCGFGFGITAFSSYVLAAFQVLTLRNVVLIDLAFFSAVFLLPSRTLRVPSMALDLTQSEKKVYLFLAILLCCGLLYTLLIPPLEWDSLAYQAYYSRLIFENGGLPTIFGPSIGIEMSAAYPPAYQMLGCYLYLFMGSSDAHFMSLLSYSSGILSLCVVLFFSTLFLPSHRNYAVVTTMAVPFFMAFSASPHYMTLLIFFNALYLYYLSQYVLTENRWSILASFLFLVIVFLKKRYNVLLGLIPLAILSPVLIRNFYFSGNPLFPLFGIGHQLQNFLWLSNTAHFKTQTIYAGLSVTSPFSILDFFVNRISSIRPLIPIILIAGPLMILINRPKNERENWFIVWFLASISIFLVRPTFDRYLLIYIPVYAVMFAWLISTSEKLGSLFLKRSFQMALMGSLSIVMVGMVITGPLMIASHVKQFPGQPLDQWAYVRQFYPHDTPCWKWLNENTPQDASVATYDIRYYYIDKQIFALDGLEAIPVYDMSPEEAVTFLRENGVIYWFSSRWTSPADETCPPAYFENPLTPYLGSDILPLIFLSGQSAVYGIGPREIDYQHIMETEQVLYPVNGVHYLFDSGRMVYFDIPGDLQDKTIVLHFSVPVHVGMYGGHATSPRLLGDILLEKAQTNELIIPGMSGKYTLYIVSDAPFSVMVTLS